MSEKQTDKNRLPKTVVRKGLATLALTGALYPLAAPNISRVWANGNMPTPRHEFPGIAGKKSNPESSDSKHNRTVPFKLGAHGRVWDIALKFKDHQNVQEAADNIETYLPDQENHFVQPNQTITVQENSDGDVIPNPGLEK